MDAFDEENEVADVAGGGEKPGVVFVGVVGAAGEEFNDGAEGALGGEDGAALAGFFVEGVVAVSVGVVAFEDGIDEVEVFDVIGDEDGAGEDGVGDGFGNFGFTAAGDGAGLVAEEAFGGGAAEAPAGGGIGADHFDFVAGGEDVGDAGEEFEGMGGFLDRAPGDALGAEVEAGVVGQVVDVGVFEVAGPAAGLGFGAVAEEGERVLEGVGEGRKDVGELELFAEVVAGEGEGAAGVFFLGDAEEVSGEGDLGFNLFLAVAEVVVGNDGDDDAGGVAGGDFEGDAVVVGLFGGFPAHAVAALAGGGVGVGGQAEFFFGNAVEVGGEDDAAGVAGP